MKKLVVLSLVLVLALVGCNTIIVPERVTGEVVEKVYREPYDAVSSIPIGDMNFPQIITYRAHHNVIVYCDGVYQLIDDEDTYNEYDVGDDIELEYVRYYNSKGDIKREKLFIVKQK